MGSESSASLVRGRSRVDGKVLLEGDHLLFRGDGERVKLMFADVTPAEAHDGALLLTHAGGTLRLVLPDGVAERWLAKIRTPKSLLDKLGVRAGMRVAVLGVDDADFLRQLRERVPDIDGRVAPDTDLVLLAAESTADLRPLARLRGRLRPAGAIWVVHRKGKGGTLRDVELFAAAREAGLVDNKVVSFSATHTAERLVIPKSERQR